MLYLCCTYAVFMLYLCLIYALLMLYLQGWQPQDASLDMLRNTLNVLFAPQARMLTYARRACGGLRLC
jgi:hypothetical protein